MCPSFNSPFLSPLIVFNICDPTFCLPWISLLQFHSYNFTPSISLPQFPSRKFIPVISLPYFSFWSISPNFSSKLVAPSFHILEFFTHNFSPLFWSMLKLLLLSTWTLGCGTLCISHILLKVRSLANRLFTRLESSLVPEGFLTAQFLQKL